MEPWKLVTAGIIAAYLLVASAISATVDHLATTPKPRLGQELNAHSQSIFVADQECLDSEDESDRQEPRPIWQSNDQFGTFMIQRWDLRGSSEIVGYAPIDPCEEQRG
ncbi:MAG TPA: hypothetical protein VKT73_16630 [Xanthobacteraceae bacterium]|nr:hypothetical protein [Xanthobacteraceae bacterium]